jgi:NAD(P)-dependent dehydrogenase (short-subunit alcohol dehydrogenase family)
MSRDCDSLPPLDGQTWVIVGATGGLGRALTLAVAARGATVVLVGRHLGRLEALYDALEASGAPQPAIAPFAFESAHPQDFQRLATTLAGEFPRLDALVHCAAYLGPRTPWAQYSAEDWQTALQVNATVPLYMTQALMPLLLKSERALIAATLDGRVANPGKAYWGGYAASKAALACAWQSLADEHSESPHLRILSWDPGPLCTNLRASAFPGENPTHLTSPEAAARQWLARILDQTPHPVPL